MLFTVLIINTIIFVSAFNMPDNQTLIESKAGDYLFDTPDVVKDYVRDDGTRVRLNAYKTSKNQALIPAIPFENKTKIGILLPLSRQQTTA